MRPMERAWFILKEMSQSNMRVLSVPSNNGDIDYHLMEGNEKIGGVRVQPDGVLVAAHMEPQYRGQQLYHRLLESILQNRPGELIAFDPNDSAISSHLAFQEKYSAENSPIKVSDTPGTGQGVYEKRADIANTLPMVSDHSGE